MARGLSLQQFHASNATGWFRRFGGFSRELRCLKNSFVQHSISIPGTYFMENLTFFILDKLSVFQIKLLYYYDRSPFRQIVDEKYV